MVDVLYIAFLLLVVVVCSSTNPQLNSSSLFVLQNTENSLVTTSIIDLGVDEPVDKVWFCWSEYATRRPTGYGANEVKISGIALNRCIKVYSDEIRGDFRYAYKLSKIDDDTTALKYTYFNDPDCTQRDIAYRRSFGYLFYMYGQAGLYVTDAEDFHMFLTTDDKIPLPIGVSFAVNLTFDNYFSCNTTTDVSQAYRFSAYRQDYCFSMLPRLGSFGSLYRLPIVRYSDHSCTWCGLSDIIDMNICQTVKTITRVNLGDCDYIWKIYDIPYDNNPTMPTRPMLNVDSYVELPEHRQLFKRWIVMYTPGPTTSPTITPTITPTWTNEPSPEPSTKPSMEPTTQPSPEPSIEPTIQPSPAPTTTPAPSRVPGSDRNTYNFNVEQILVGISSLTYASQYTLHNSIVRDTIGAVLNIPPIWVTILTVSTLSPININNNLLSFMSYFTSLALTDRCLVKYKVQFNTTAIKNKQYIDKPELVYLNLTALLIDSINNSTQFTDILHYKAEQQGVTVFDQVTSDVPKTTAFKPDYVYIDGTSSKKPNRDTLIWSIFCSVLVSVCWLYLGVHYCRKYYLKRRENRAVVPIREDIELTEHCSNDNSIAVSGSGNSVHDDDNVSVRSGAAVYEQAIVIENDNNSNDSTRIEAINNVHNTQQNVHTTSTPVTPFEVIEIVTNDKNNVSEQKIDEYEEKVDFSDEEKPDFGVKVKPSQSKSTTLRLKPKPTPTAQHKYAVAVSNTEDEMIDIETQDFDNYIV